MLDGDRSVVAGLQWAATAFYLVAVAHGLARHRGNDATTRRWTPVYLGGMAAAFVIGCRRAGSHRTNHRVTSLLVAGYLPIRVLAAVLDQPGEDRHLRGAAVEALTLLLAYVLVYDRRIVPCGDKTQ